MTECHGTTWSDQVLFHTLLSAKSSLKADLQTSWHLVIVEILVALSNVFEFV
jgi:hypothetical protein